MARVSLSACDRCHDIDQDDDPVRRIGVCGVLMDLCASCRFMIMGQAGVSEAAALQVIRQQNGEPSIRTKARSLNAVETDAAQGTDGAGDESDEDEPSIVTQEDASAEVARA